MTKVPVTAPSSKMKTKTPVESFTNPQLDEWCARAQEWELDAFDQLAVWTDKSGSIVSSVHEYSPTTNNAQAMGLAKYFTLVVNFETGLVYNPNNSIEYCDYININIAICRAVIASKYGEYVEID